MHIDIHASNRVRTCYPSVQAGIDGSYLRPRGYCDRRPSEYIYLQFLVITAMNSRTMPTLCLIEASILKRRLRFNFKVVRVKFRVDSRMGHVSAEYVCSPLLFTFRKMHFSLRRHVQIDCAEREFLGDYRSSWFCFYKNTNWLPFLLEGTYPEVLVQMS
jgi:hypothetical protein